MFPEIVPAQIPSFQILVICYRILYFTQIERILTEIQERDV